MGTMSFGGPIHHDHDCSEHDCSEGFSLFQYVDTDRVRCLNESEEGSCKRLFRGWSDRTDTSVACHSDEDPELIVFVPFTCDVKIKSIAVVGGADGAGPSRMRVWTNRDDIDFGSAESVKPLQEWSLADNFNGALEYPTRYTKFQGVNTVTLHFPQSFSGDKLTLHYIGFKGEATGNRREEMCTFVYESRAQPKDHKAPAEAKATQFLM